MVASVNGVTVEGATDACEVFEPLDAFTAVIVSGQLMLPLPLPLKKPVPASPTPVTSPSGRKARNRTVLGVGPPGPLSNPTARLPPVRARRSSSIADIEAQFM